MMLLQVGTLWFRLASYTEGFFVFSVFLGLIVWVWSVASGGLHVVDTIDQSKTRVG